MASTAAWLATYLGLTRNGRRASVQTPMEAVLVEAIAPATVAPKPIRRAPEAIVWVPGH